MKCITSAALVFVGLASLGTAAPSTSQVPLFEGLGPYTRQVTTRSPEAQRYFNQGLAFLHGFNHGMAIRSFQEAARLDPACAMAHWGVALAAGPHINFPAVPPDMAALAWKELGLARQHAGAGTPVEQALIQALGHRYADPQPEDRSPLDRAYADAMREVWRAHPRDPDVGTLFAESLLDLRPWDQWTPDGRPQPGTEEAAAALDAVLALNPQHPFANHLYIHTLEASPHPERALAAADRLRDLQPAIAHNVHMPTHIDIRVGRWHDAIRGNLKAVAADQAFRRIVGPPKGFIHVYIAHNRHMLGYAAMMTGQSELALEHMRALVAGLPADFVKEFAQNVEGWNAMPMETMVRFGRWDDILTEPADYPNYMPFTRAFHHAARGIAFAAKGDLNSARAEQANYTEAAKLVPPEETLGNNTTVAILAVVTPMLDGEILVRTADVEQGLARLREAVAAEDRLRYDEPPGWIVPARHSLGATLMNLERYAEAEAIYREDLARLPDNGWSLFGLSESLYQQGKRVEAAAALEKFSRAWKNGDVKITSSCFCQPGERVARN